MQLRHWGELPLNAKTTPPLEKDPLLIHYRGETDSQYYYYTLV